MADLGKLARDTGYVLLGLTILRVQRAQVHRREIEREIGTRLDQVGHLLPEPVRHLISHG